MASPNFIPSPLPQSPRLPESTLSTPSRGKGIVSNSQIPSAEVALPSAKTEDEKDDSDDLAPVLSEVHKTKLSRSPSIFTMQVDQSQCTEDVELKQEIIDRSTTCSPAGNVERKSKSTRASERRLLLSNSNGTKRRSPRLLSNSLGRVENEDLMSGSNLLRVDDKSQKQTCDEMLISCLERSDWRILSSQSFLESRKVEMTELNQQKEKRKLDYSGENADLPANSPGKKTKVGSCGEKSQDERKLPFLRQCSATESTTDSSPTLPSGLHENGHVKPEKSGNSGSRTNSTSKVNKLRNIASCDVVLRRSPRGVTSPMIEAPEKSGNLGSRTNSTSKVNKRRNVASCDVVLRRSPRGVTSPIIEAPPAKPRKKQKSAIDNSDSDEGMGDRDNDDDHKRCFFIGKPVPDKEARESWPWRYQTKSERIKSRCSAVNDGEEEELILNIKCHYAQAWVNNCTYNIGDCAYMRGEEGSKYIGKIIEFFQTEDEEDYCRVQWFYRATDTVMKDEASFHEKKRVFYSTIMDDNPLDCISSKIKVVHITPQLKLKKTPMKYDYYYDMEYNLDYSTFRVIPTETAQDDHELSLPNKRTEPYTSKSNTALSLHNCTTKVYKRELSLLDLYSGCGAMSTGLCLGARMSGVNLKTRWAVDLDSSACKSLRQNHPETKVRNEAADDFLELLKQWEKLCKTYDSANWRKAEVSTRQAYEIDEKNTECEAQELEVERVVDICYGDPDNSGERGLKFKVRWMGYGPSEDTWEPIAGLRNCQERVSEFVTKWKKSKSIPLPGEVDVICGGPPCQGISGYNRFRSLDDPMEDDRNRQVVVFMDIVKFLKPKYVLMENVTDILKFNKASLGRYALSRLVHMNYQARIGIVAAGCYGLPQFRLRVFFWGAVPSEDLPQFPLPTHDVILKYGAPVEFERNVVAYDEGQSRNKLQAAVVLRDAISDLPPVKNGESAEEMRYAKSPETEFQTYIRSTQKGKAILYDHTPLPLHEDDYIRVCHVPHRKGANFRDLPGIIVGSDNVVRRDPDNPSNLPSGKPMVPDYALTFEQGKSRRPFARLWWDENLATIVTTPTCHSQKTLHPEQDRVLTVRECARLQGFPDNYRFSGTIKKRYRQIGNAVAVPVAKALGYAMGLASLKLIGKEHLMELPPNFSYEMP